MWWATKNEWLGLLDAAGLELEAVYEPDKSPLTVESREYVFVAAVGKAAPGSRSASYRRLSAASSELSDVR